MIYDFVLCMQKCDKIGGGTYRDQLWKLTKIMKFQIKAWARDGN